MPDIQFSYLAIALAVFANFILGFVWYTFLFKPSWAVEMGFDPEMEPEKGKVQKGMLLTIFGNILIAGYSLILLLMLFPQTASASEEYYVFDRLNLERMKYLKHFSLNSRYLNPREA